MPQGSKSCNAVSVLAVFACYIGQRVASLAIRQCMLPDTQRYRSVRYASVQPLAPETKHPTELHALVACERPALLTLTLEQPCKGIATDQALVGFQHKNISLHDQRCTAAAVCLHTTSVQSLSATSVARRDLIQHNKLSAVPPKREVLLQHARAQRWKRVLMPAAAMDAWLQGALQTSSFCQL